MTRKSKARYGISRTYKLNAAVKALRIAIFAGMAATAVVPSVQAAGTCVEDPTNTVTCSGDFTGTLDSGDELLVSQPFGAATIILDDTTVIDTTDHYGVFAINNMDLTLISDAEITVTNAGDAVGIYAISAYGTSDVTNNGSITVTSDSGVAAGLASVSGYGDASATNNGSISVYSETGFAVGMYIGAEFGDVTAITGADSSITASSYDGDATGIELGSYAGDISVDSAGSITATSYNGAAQGIVAETIYGSVTIDNSGDISASSTDGFAGGIYATSVYGDVTVNNSGNITAESEYSAAIGVLAASYVAGNVLVNNEGTISASTYQGVAIGVYAYGLYDVGVTGSGDISATSHYGSAIGISARNGNDYGPVTIDVSGDITVETYASGSAIGINVYSYAGDVNVTSAGVITASNTYGAAIGIKTGRFGYSTIDNSGAITTDTYVGNSIGIQADSFYGSYITNSGDLVASTTYGSARGIQALTTFDVTVINSGDITATSYATGSAQGIRAKSTNGAATVTNSGDISATSTYTNAIAILATAYYDVTINNSGDLTTSTDFAIGYGIYANSRFYASNITNSGDINAHSTNLTASGIYAFGNSVMVDSSGDITATSDYDNAYGIYASTVYGNADITSSGAVTVSAMYDATGLFATTLYGEANITNSGDVSASSTNSPAYGLYASARNNNATITNSGDVTAYSQYSDASAIVAISSENTTVNNSGALTATSVDGDAIGIVAITENYELNIDNSGDITATSTNGNAYGIYAYNINGDINVTSSGDMSISSSKYYAVGILALNEYGAINVTSASNITAEAIYAGAYGMYVAAGAGDINISNSGDMAISSVDADATGIRAAAVGAITIANTGDITVDSPNNAFGIYVTTYDSIAINNNAAITATGAYAAGIYAAAGAYSYSEYGGSVVLGDVSVTTGSASNIHADGDYAAGLYLTATGTVTVNNGGAILANSGGEYGSAIGILVNAMSTATISNSGSINATGTDPWAIASYAESTSITNASTGKIWGAIMTDAGADTFTNNGKWYVGDDNITSFGDGDDSIVNSATGQIFMEGSTIDMGYAEGSTNSFLNNGKLFAKGSGNTIDMADGTFTNNGSSIHMEDGDTNDSVTIIGDFAGNGHVVVDANGTTMTADHLNIVGNVVAGTANIIDVNMAHGPSIADMLAGDVINIVNVTGTSVAANFTTGAINIAQDELYTVQGGIVKTGGNFGLGFSVTGLSASGVLASDISPGVQSLWNQGTGTLFQREGSHHPDEGETPDYKAGVWARYYGASGSVSPDAHHDNFGAGGSNNFDQDISGWEVGVSYAFNNQWAVGLLGGGSDSTLNPDVGGRAKIYGDTFGGYVTYTPGNGFYADLSYRAMSFDGNAQGGQTAFGYKGDANGYNLELGYGFKSSEGLIVEPQFQFSQVDVSMHNIDYHGADYDLTDGTSSLLRLGAAVRQTFDTSSGSWTPYGAASYLDELDGNNNYNIGGLGGSVDTSGGSVLLEAGVSGVFNSFGYSLGMNWRDGSAYDSVFGGQVSVRYDW